MRVASLACLLLILAPLLGASAAQAQQDGERLRTPTGSPIFLRMVNYEGPADRAWQMWEDGKFDPRLIEDDLARALAAGANAVRIFVQRPLAGDATAGRWQKLDTLMALAAQRGLYVVVTLYDYAERDLSKVATVDGLIAARYRGHPALLAYDLRNEPRFYDLATARFAEAARPPLQETGLIETYGERVARADIPTYREPEAGHGVPVSLTDDEAYIYVNNLASYRQFLDEAAAWTSQAGSGASTMDYPGAPEAQRWKPLLQALEASYSAWLAPQIAAIRGADPTSPLTIGHTDVVLASLSSNLALDYHTLHRYPTANAAGIKGAISLASRLRATFPGRPVVLGEFGFATNTLPAERAAVLETAVYLGLLSAGAAGGGKWMLNDFPQGFNPRENNLGMYRGDGSPKPIVPALAEVGRLLGPNPAVGGVMDLGDESGGGIWYTYRSGVGEVLGGTSPRSEHARAQLDSTGHLFLRWVGPPEAGWLRVRSTATGRVELDPAGLVGDAQGAQEVKLLAVEPTARIELPYEVDQSRLAFQADGGRAYLLRTGLALARGLDFDAPNGRFFSQANGFPPGEDPDGFVVSDEGAAPFWEAYRRLGGSDALGYPISHRFDLDGFTVQAFQKAALQWNPAEGRVDLLNIFDMLHDRGQDVWLAAFRQIPSPAEADDGEALSWETILERQVAILDSYPEIKAYYLGTPDWLDRYGLPVAAVDQANSVVVRAQRAAFQLWKSDVPWAKAGEISVANAGELAAEAGLWPPAALEPMEPPA